jgi:hypothetical protein
MQTVILSVLTCTPPQMEVQFSYASRGRGSQEGDCPQAPRQRAAGREVEQIEQLLRYTTRVVQ